MKSNLNFFDKLMIALTFAEENVPEAVMEIGTKCETKGPCLTLFGKDHDEKNLAPGELGTRAEA